jgi:hypothetical protein
MAIPDGSIKLPKTKIISNRTRMWLMGIMIGNIVAINLDLMSENITLKWWKVPICIEYSWKRRF